MSNCSMCGAGIPDHQRVCSMCYGDPAFGSDGYYQRWLDEQEQRERQREEEVEPRVER